MNDLEQRIRDLPRPSPSQAIDERIAALLAPARNHARLPQSRRPAWAGFAATAVAAGLAGFAAGIGTGQLMLAPPGEPQVADAADEQPPDPPETEPQVVHLTDARVTAGLDFSQSLEPFRVEPLDQEGS